MTTTVAVYAGANGIGDSCSGNSTNPVALMDILQSPSDCLRVAADLFAKLPALCADDDPHGEPLAWFSDGACASPLALDPGASYYGGYGFCARAALRDVAAARSYVVSCKASPTSATAAWVTTLAVLLAAAVLGLILYWLWRDREATRAAAREAARLAASIDAEKGKAARIASAKENNAPKASYGTARGSYSSLDIEVGGGSGGSSPDRRSRR